MNDRQLADKIQLTELVNKLFMYVDDQRWEQVLNEVFTKEVWFDMTSVSGKAKKLPAKDICEMWRQGFIGLDSVHHQAGHYLIMVNDDSADIYAYAMAAHFKKAATKGHSRMFVGSYELKASRSENEWRLTQFKYNLKFIDGNVSLE